MSRIEVPMPQMGESIAEGTVSVWLKAVGDRVERDEPLMEISTDKVDAEIPSPAEGRLAQILVQAGETVEVGSVVAYIETDVTAALPAKVPGSSPVEPVGAWTAADAGTAAAAAGDSTVSNSTESSSVSAGEGEELPVPRPSSAAPTAESLEERIRTRSSPLVRRMAREHGVDIRAIRGSGRLGRVTKEDILAYVRNGARGGAPGGGGGGLDWNSYYTHVQHPTCEASAGDRVEPMSRMTRLIAEHMVISTRVSPHVHSFFEIDYSRVDQVRAAAKARWEEQGVKVSYTAFIARAVATALREHPKLNASISGDDVVYRSDVNLGVAVALPWGLIVPVMKQADQLSLVGIASRISDLAERARAKKLSPEEVQGGTFTITNPGIFGAVVGFPIINQPQVGILCVGGIEKRPVVITDEFGNDAIVPRRRGYLSLGFDHRLVNGADGDSFLARVKELLESAVEA